MADATYCVEQNNALKLAASAHTTNQHKTCFHATANAGAAFAAAASLYASLSSQAEWLQKRDMRCIRRLSNRSKGR